MKVLVVLACLVVGLSTAFPRLSHAQDEKKEAALTPPPKVSDSREPTAAGALEFRSWHQGEPPVKLIRKEEGFCALTGLGGGFAGGGEQAHVYVDKDGYWYLGGKSMQSGVSAECVVVRYPPAPKARDKKIKILAASYSFGSDYADVTGRVRELVRTGTTFQANPGWLHTDPHPYWNKALVILCRISRRTAIFSVGENEDVSRELLLTKSRPVTDKAVPYVTLSSPTAPPASRSVDVPEQVEDQDDKQDGAKAAARPVAPAPAVAPGGQRSEEQQENDDKDDERHTAVVSLQANDPAAR